MAAIYLVREYVVEFMVCIGPSMMPTFNPRGDVTLVEHVSVWTHNIQIGDVVLARSAQNPRHSVMKRVLGMEGDMVYIPSATKLGLGRTVEVPRGHVWLQGDNFANSTDSRHYGAVPYALLRGRVFLKVWPPWEAGWVERGLDLQPWQADELEKQRRQRAEEEAEQQRRQARLR
ncbi:mitochondrial inner membrane protease subunit 1-like [Chlorella sorokiniana]|uniref:Mitochondrial inner membrane protease subunit 1-like n=1 Tax=Chlorella sorokiniana TaxID=3076 RepID=A0A2P6TMA1_CHLSO|nr:mitochondrial inner membrane protease subunit 1-like [Chlorella sorokiniana]|eukprot:PRW45470.1 mitochondrial inner membrane protease subunit 1-like [Chlorella sorokiniana]